MTHWRNRFESPGYSNWACDVVALGVTVALVVALLKISAFLVGWQ